VRFYSTRDRKGAGGVKKNTMISTLRGRGTTAYVFGKDDRPPCGQEDPSSKFQDGNHNSCPFPLSHRGVGRASISSGQD
jgi:hypothetical protein